MTPWLLVALVHAPGELLLPQVREHAMTPGHSGTAYLLNYLMDHLSCLYAPTQDRPGRYRIVYSEVVSTNMSASIELASETVRIHIARDRSDHVTHFQSVPAGPKAKAYGIDLVMSLLTGDPGDPLDPAADGRFICEHIDEIERRFGAENWSETKAELERLERIRTKKLWG